MAFRRSGDDLSLSARGLRVFFVHVHARVVHKGAVFLVSAQHADGGKQGIGVHAPGERETGGEGIAPCGAVLPAGQSVQIKVGFGERIFGGAPHRLGVFIGREKPIEHVCLHALHAERSRLGGGGFALLFARYLRDIELNEAVAGDKRGDFGADELSCAVTVRQDNQRAFLRQGADEGGGLLMVEDAEAICFDDLRPVIDHGKQAQAVVFALHKDGIGNFKLFFCFGQKNQSFF